MITVRPVTDEPLPESVLDDFAAKIKVKRWLKPTLTKWRNAPGWSCISADGVTGIGLIPASAYRAWFEIKTLIMVNRRGDSLVSSRDGVMVP